MVYWVLAPWQTCGSGTQVRKSHCGSYPLDEGWKEKQFCKGLVHAGHDESLRWLFFPVHHLEQCFTTVGFEKQGLNKVS